MLALRGEAAGGHRVRTQTLRTRPKEGGDGLLPFNVLALFFMSRLSVYELVA